MNFPKNFPLRISYGSSVRIPLPSSKKSCFSFLMNRNTEDAVRLFCGQLEKCFDTYDFQSQFGYILADRGSAFNESESLGTEFMGI